MTIPRPQLASDFKTILYHVEAITGVEQSLLFSGSRTPTVCAARSMLAYCCREFCGMTYAEIAQAMGKAAHSTLIDGEARFRGKLITTQEELERATREARESR